MYCDKKLNTIANFVTTEADARESLRNVRIEGNTATATNGHLLLTTTFKEDPIESRVEHPITTEEVNFNVSGTSINKAFKEMPKKNPFVPGIYVTPSTVATIVSKDNVYKYTDKVNQYYPAYKQVLPVPASEDTVVTLGKDALTKLINGLKGHDYNSITFRVPAQSGGSVKSGIALTVNSTYDADFTGIVMPYRTPEELRNNDNILFIHDDVAQMIALLQETVPEHEITSYMVIKYGKLLTKVEEEKEAEEVVESAVEIVLE